MGHRQSNGSTTLPYPKGNNFSNTTTSLRVSDSNLFIPIIRSIHLNLLKHRPRNDSTHPADRTISSPPASFSIRCHIGSWNPRRQKKISGQMANRRNRPLPPLTDDQIQNASFFADASAENRVTVSLNQHSWANGTRITERPV